MASLQCARSIASRPAEGKSLHKQRASVGWSVWLLGPLHGSFTWPRAFALLCDLFAAIDTCAEDEYQVPDVLGLGINYLHCDVQAHCGLGNRHLIWQCFVRARGLLKSVLWLCVVAWKGVTLRMITLLLSRYHPHFASVHPYRVSDRPVVSDSSPSCLVDLR